MSPARANPRRPSPRETARDAFRAGLREAAERVFARAGFHATKMTDVARAAGVAVGTLYNYFDSKEEIFQEIFIARSRELHAELEPALALPKPSDRLSAVVRTAFEYIDRYGALFAMFVERGAQAEYDLQRLGGDVCEAEYDRFLAILHKLLQGAIDAGELRSDVSVAAMVATLSGAMNGATYAWLKRRRRGRLVGAADDLLKLFLSGARATS